MERCYLVNRLNGLTAEMDTQADFLTLCHASSTPQGTNMRTVKQTADSARMITLKMNVDR